MGQGVHATQKIGGNLEFSYKCNLKEVDFSDTVNVANGINEWVKQITNGKIPTFVDAESLSNSMMILINAIYFRGLWKVPFEKTKSLNFQVGGKMNVTKEFVEQVSEHDYLYSKALNAKIIRLPYEGGKFSMFVLLPFKVDGLNDLIDQLDAKILKQEVDRMDIVEVIVTLPKFKFESAMQLNQIIRSVRRKN